jgi:hypothetical protein
MKFILKPCQSSSASSKNLFILTVCLALLNISCGGDGITSVFWTPTPTPTRSQIQIPTPPSIALRAHPSPPYLPGQEKVTISVDIISGITGDLRYTWESVDGEIVAGQGTQIIEYRAPNQPGTYEVGLTVRWDGQSIARSIQIEVAVTPTSEICPGRYEIGEEATLVEVQVADGQVAYLIGWGFDPSGDGHLEFGGYFVTINGPYERTHAVQNGVYCPPVPANSDQAQATQKMLEDECEAGGADGCNHLILPSTEICPGRHETGLRTELIEVKVGPGEVTYIIGVGFDPSGDGNIEYGGYFVTINGPYERTHAVQNGVYCPPVPANTEQARATQRMLEGECQDKCNHWITLP